MDSKESVQKKATLALKHAVKNLVKEHQAKNGKLIVWKNGKVVHVSAKKL